MAQNDSLLFTFLAVLVGLVQGCDSSQNKVHSSQKDRVTMENLGVSSFRVTVGRRLVAFSVEERAEVKDLNGDGDRDDHVPFVYDRLTRKMSQLEVGIALSSIEVSGSNVIFVADEFETGSDLNGNGRVPVASYPREGILRVWDAESRMETSFPEISTFPSVFAGEWAVTTTSEPNRGEDLNGDGDQSDAVVQVLNLKTARVRNTGVAARYLPRSADRMLGSVAFLVPENAQGGADLNGDGDAKDEVLHVLEISSQTCVNRSLAIVDIPRGDGAAFVVRVSEDEQGNVDLNGDGDCRDLVLYLIEKESENLGYAVSRSTWIHEGLVAFEVLESAHGERDLNGDEDSSDSIVHLYDLKSRRALNLRCSGYINRTFHMPSAERVALIVSETDEAEDLNGDGDLEDHVLCFFSTETGHRESTGLACSLGSPLAVQVANSLIIVLVSEWHQGKDYDGDGELVSEVLHVVDGRTGEIVILQGSGGLALSTFDGNWFSYLASEAGGDLNGDGVLTGGILHVFDAANLSAKNLLLGAHTPVLGPSLVAASVQERLQRLDLNQDGDLEDSILHLAWLGTDQESSIGSVKFDGK